MTSLIFQITEERVIVATDTLVVRRGDSSPIAFTSKIFALPHLDTLMVCTGLAQFAWEWAFKINGEFVAPNVETLNMNSPAVLRQLWVPHRDVGCTSTVYHFVADAGRIRTFVFRSEKNFNVEEVSGECVAYKPPFEGQSADTWDGIDEIVAAMEKQRAEQASKPLDKRVAIGGEMIVAILSTNGHIELWRAHRFSDYDEHLMQMTGAQKNSTLQEK